MLLLWDVVSELYGNSKVEKIIPKPKVIKDSMKIIEESIDYVPCNLPKSKGIAKAVVLEDNDAVIKMCLKVRAPTMRHVARTHRVDVDSLLERIHSDTHIVIKYINTKLQIADIFTKGSFTAQTWNNLCRLLQVGPIAKVAN